MRDLTEDKKDRMGGDKELPLSSMGFHPPSGYAYGDSKNWGDTYWSQAQGKRLSTKSLVGLGGNINRMGERRALRYHGVKELGGQYIGPKGGKFPFLRGVPTAEIPDRDEIDPHIEEALKQYNSPFFKFLEPKEKEHIQRVLKGVLKKSRIKSEPYYEGKSGDLSQYLGLRERQTLHGITDLELRSMLGPDPMRRTY